MFGLDLEFRLRIRTKMKLWLAVFLMLLVFLVFTVFVLLVLLCVLAGFACI